MEQTQKEKKNFNKSALALLGSVLTYAMIGNSLSWIATTHHIINNIDSGIILHQDQFKNSNLLISLILIVAIFALANIANAISPFLLSKRNIRTTLLISYLLLISSHFIIYYTSQLSFVIIALCIYGISLGISYQPMMINLFKHYNENRGVVGFICSLSFCISPLIFVFIRSLLSNIKVYIWICIVIYGLTALISIAVSFDYENDKSIDANFDNNDSMSTTLLASGEQSEKEISIHKLHSTKSNMISNINSSGSGRNSFVSMSSMNTINTNINNLIAGDNKSIEDIIKEKYKDDMLYALTSFNTLALIIINISMILFSFSTLFTISINEGDDEDAYYELRQYQIQLFIISFSVSKFISPLLSSLLNVKIITIAILVTNVFISFMLKGNLDNILTVIVSGIAYGNSSVVVSIMSSVIYGDYYSMSISSIVNALSSLSAFAAVLLLYKAKKSLHMITGCVCIFALVMSGMIKVKAFDFSEVKESKGIEMKEKMNVSNSNANFEYDSENDVKSDRESVK